VTAKAHIQTGSVREAYNRDRRVYLYSHPALFALLTVSRRLGTMRLGRTLVVHDADAYRLVLTRLKLNRLDRRSTGGLAREFSPGSVLFDQEGDEHKGARRALAGQLGAGAVAALRPVWQEILERRLEPLGHDGQVDMVTVATEIAAATACALLEADAHPVAVGSAAIRVASAAVRARLPGLPSASAARHAASLAALLGTGDARAAMLAVAAVNTTVAGLPRAVAWCADAGLWDQAADIQSRAILTDELLRVIAPSPLLPRVAAAAGTAGRHRVRAGDRLLLITRHAAQAHTRPPDCAHPAHPSVAQLVFGAGPHACPGAHLARAQFADTLAALAPYRPTVVRALVSRRTALPGWRSLTIRAADQ
jgi:cytochrome P450